jgi:putative peptide zinc metalloprotease protein
MRRLTALLASVTATAVLAAPATAGGGDNVVRASPTVDGTAIHRARVAVTTTGADTVDSTNLAEANPHDCTGCEGIAVAFQAVIATGHPSTFTPQNLAVAVNSNCTRCGAFAFAYQYVVTADDSAHLSGGSRRTIRDIRAQADQLVDAGLPYPELDARLKDLGAQFQTAVADGLRETNGHPRGGRDEEHTDALPAPTG